MASSSSSSSVVPIRRKGGWTYDVFLSFRGEDTRNNFVDHLFAALTLKGIHTFKDDKLRYGGQPISEELMKAIQESRWAVVVFSKNYAKTSWCLEELSYIMEWHDQLGGQKKVLPVFYHVNPSDVHKQNADFTTAVEGLKDKLKGGVMDKVNKWRDALTEAASLSGQRILLDHGGESAFINKIVQQILLDKQPRGGSRENHLIGIEPRIDALISLLKLEATEEVDIVGICGMGGIGKTTIAQALFKRIAHKFEGSSFVTDVRENSSSKKDMCSLQQMILQDILGVSSGFEIFDPEVGAKIIRERCHREKVLLVLDDVNDVEQLEYLAATRESFGPGSRIIITTRDQHLLSYVSANDMYRPAFLRTHEALQLFSRHAFRKSSPPDGYMDLSNRAINCTHGLPLALKVLGSFLCGREAGVWESALDTLAKTRSVEVLDTLKLSFDNLNDSEKQIFLDIACFYKGKDVDYVTRILDSFGFDPVIGINVLVEKSLITISSNNRLDMHHLIREMGRIVVQTAAPNSRLWELKTIHDLIGKKRKNPNSSLRHLQEFRDLTWKTDNWEQEVIEGIVVPWEKAKESLSADVFKSMKNLRLLECCQNFTSCEPTFLPDELRWFCWRQYPFSSLPVAHMSKLVGLEMEFGDIKYLWKGEKIMLQNLKFINLRKCGSLTRFPDVSGAPNIESLNLSECRKLVEVDESVGSLKKLRYWDMDGCIKLNCLPSMLKMESLETLIISSCDSLKRIREFSPCMVNLSILDIGGCSELEEVPSSIKYLSNLSYLNLGFCLSLNNIPDVFQSMESLEVLHIDSIHIHALIYSCYLRKLHLDGDLGDNDFPKNLHGLSFLEELHISFDDKLIQLPKSISHLSSLKHLEICYCVKLQTLHGLPSGIQVLIVEYCKLLEKIEDVSKEYKCLNKIRISGCPKLVEAKENRRYLDKMLDRSFVVKKWAAVDGCLIINIPGSNIPSWFKEQQDGCKIALKLPPKWQTEIIGFAICCISTRWLRHPGITLTFESDEMLFSKSEAHNINETEEADWYLWTAYIPYSPFKQFQGGNDNDFEGEDWFHMTKGNLVFEISSYYSKCIVRCGAKIVYKEAVASIQQTIPSISSNYWSWEVTNEFTNSFKCWEASSRLRLLPRSIGWTYDVFLSYRGEDTRNSFVDHLYEVLTLKGMHTFKDDNMLNAGQPFSEELVKAIKESKFAVVVFSKDYSRSSRCLEELSMIMECQNQMGQIVLPVLYYVHPSDVCKENGHFAMAFKMYEDKFKGEMDKVNTLRNALGAAAYLSDYHISPDYGGEDIERVTRIHDCFGYHPIIGIRILIEKSLVIVSDNKLEMHDLIQEMGWNIVDECSPNSRLWKVEKVHHFIKNRELEGVKAIVLPNKQYSVHQKLLHFSADVFDGLKSLQLLDVSRKFTSCEPTILPRGLRWISWKQYPFSSLPLADKCELVGIEMHGGNIKHLWAGTKIMRNLKYLHLQRLDYLTRFPDVSKAPFIERLVLTYCRNLVEVHESLGYHKRLIYVDMSDCRKLNSFPSIIEMDSLETLIMSRCSSLERFPEVTIPTVRLSNICLDDCSRIKELPSSIGYLCNLSCLNLARCTSLKNIPNSISELKCLTSLNLEDCIELLTLPGEFGSMEKLEELRLGYTDSYRALQRLPPSINFYSLKNMCSLRKLDLSWRHTENKGFPEDLHAFSSLEELNLSGNFELTELPASIYHLSHLKYLELNDCYKLQSLHSLPPALQVLRASGCSSLEMIEDIPEKYEWLHKIWLVGCWKLPDQEDETNPSKMLLLSFIKKCAAVGHRLSIAIPGNKVPSWFKQRHGCDIPIELPPRWHSHVMGFVVSCVFNRMWKIGRDYPVIKFRIVNYGEFIPAADISNPMSQSQILFADGKKTSISKPQNRTKPQLSEVDYINDTSSSADIDTVWIGYVPFGSFEHIGDDWSGMEGNLAISIKLKTGQLPVRCGIHIVYKEDLESIQQTNTSISDYSKLDCVRRVGQNYIYEDEF